MKQWEIPKETDLKLSSTMESWGTGWICPVCCKPSNVDKNEENAQHIHTGQCPHDIKNNGGNWGESFAVLIPNTARIRCS